MHTRTHTQTVYALCRRSEAISTSAMWASPGSPTALLIDPDWPESARTIFTWCSLAASPATSRVSCSDRAISCSNLACAFSVASATSAASCNACLLLLALPCPYLPLDGALPETDLVILEGEICLVEVLGSEEARSCWSRATACRSRACMSCCQVERERFLSFSRRRHWSARMRTCSRSSLQCRSHHVCSRSARVSATASTT